MIAATVLVIAKEPRPGHAKTRLCPPCTPDQAARLATAALHDTFGAVARVPVARRLAVLDGRPGAWLPEHVQVVPQSSGPLQRRLARAFTRLEGPAFLIGMDTPQVTAAMIVGALDELLGRGTDAVLGLAADGGWWGIGLRSPDPCVFDNVPMSTTETGACQRARLRELGLRTRLLPELRDVDYFADALAVAAAMPAASHFALAVEAVTNLIDRSVLEPAR